MAYRQKSKQVSKGLPKGKMNPSLGSLKKSLSAISDLERQTTLKQSQSRNELKEILSQVIDQTIYLIVEDTFREYMRHVGVTSFTFKIEWERFKKLLDKRMTYGKTDKR